MRLGAIAALVLVMFGAWTATFAADPHAAHAPAAAPAHATTAEAGHAQPGRAEAAHPPAVNQAVLPPAGVRWPAVMLIIVLGLFAAAVAIGVLVSPHLPPEEIPVSTSHDESHGHDHSHGHSHGSGGHH